MFASISLNEDIPQGKGTNTNIKNMHEHQYSLGLPEWQQPWKSQAGVDYVSKDVFYIFL